MKLKLENPLPLRWTYRCPLAWDSLRGDARKRFCAECGRHVHVLNEMSRDEIMKLARESSGKFCARIEALGIALAKSESPSNWKRWIAWAILAIVPIVSAACRKKDATASLPSTSIESSSQDQPQVGIRDEQGGYESAVPTEPRGGTYTINVTGTDPLCTTGYPGHGNFEIIGVPIDNPET